MFPVHLSSLDAMADTRVISLAGVPGPEDARRHKRSHGDPPGRGRTPERTEGRERTSCLHETPEPVLGWESPGPGASTRESIEGPCLPDHPRSLLCSHVRPLKPTTQRYIGTGLSTLEQEGPDPDPTP